MKPKLLDLFCGAGGCATGYAQAGFDVTGIDNRPMPRYPFKFIQADALEYLAEHGHEYDVIHASPPCQGYSAMRCLPWLKDREYSMLIEPTRRELQRIGKPYVIENVERARWAMHSPIRLCGLHFGLKVYRHRLFESSVFLMEPPHSRHREIIASSSHMTDRHRPNENGFVGCVDRAGQAGKDAMGIQWMIRDELREAVPPAFTHFIGLQIRDFLI